MDLITKMANRVISPSESFFSPSLSLSSSFKAPSRFAPLGEKHGTIMRGKDSRQITLSSTFASRYVRTLMHTMDWKVSRRRDDLETGWCDGEMDTR